MPEITVVEIVSDSPPKRGQIYGEHARTQIKQVLEMYKEVVGTLDSDTWNTAKDRLGPYLKCANKFVPDLIEEIKGIAQGSDCEFSDILAINCRSEILFRIDHPDECSTLAVLPQATANDDFFLAENWDWYKSVTENQVLLKISGRQDAPDLITFTEAGQVAKIGINKAGIALCVTNLSPNICGVGVPWILVTRKILESKYFTQAIGSVLSIPKGHSVNYLIAHTGGAAVNIESNPVSDHVIWPKDGVICHTNHYLQSSPHFIDNKTRIYITT